MGARMYQPGELIKGTVYRVVRHVATGGMGSVFDVEDTTVGKRYMLKTLHPDLFGRNDLARRMEQEARILARLQHPNIVEVVTAGETQDELRLPYYVMERLNGQNLRTVLEKKGALDPIHAFRIGIDLLDALAHAHDNGVIHRDVKPENVFLHRNLNGTTTTKLLDFGIMRLLDTATKTDTMGRFVGTMRYASPEQILVHTLTPMTDVYSAGLVIYEMLAGQGPYDDIRDLPEVGRAHIQTPPPPLSRFVQLPREVEALVMGSLAKEPSQRPKDAFRYAGELRRMLRDAENAPRSAETQVSPLTAAPSNGGAPAYSPSGPTREPGAALDSTQLPSTRLEPLHPPVATPAMPATKVAAHPPTLQMPHAHSQQHSQPPTQQQAVPSTVPQPGYAPQPPSTAADRVSGDEATMLNLADAAAAANARVALASTLASPGVSGAAGALGAPASLPDSDGPTVQRTPGVTADPRDPRGPGGPANPIGPTLASNAGLGYAGHAVGPNSPQSHVLIPSAAPPSPATALMPQPAPAGARPPQPSFDASQAAPHTAQPATPLMRQRVPSVQPAVPAAPGVGAVSSPPGVDRNADTRGYVPPAQGRAPGVQGSDTHRTDENGRTIAANMDLVFPRGHGAMPQSSTGGVGMSMPTSRRAPRSKTPAMLTGMVLAFVALVPTGFVMKRVVPRAGATAAAVPLHDVAASSQAVAAPAQPTPTQTTASTAATVGALGAASAATAPSSAALAAAPAATIPAATIPAATIPAATTPVVAGAPAAPARPGARPAGKSRPPEKGADTPAAPGAAPNAGAAKPAAATKPDGPGVDL